MGKAFRDSSGISKSILIGLEEGCRPLCTVSSSPSDFDLGVWVGGEERYKGESPREHALPHSRVRCCWGRESFWHVVQRHRACAGHGHMKWRPADGQRAGLEGEESSSGTNGLVVWDTSHR